MESVDAKASNTSSLAFDTAGQPMIAYSADNNTRVKFARKSSSWTLESVDTTLATWISLAMSPSGYPAIAYSHSSTNTTSDTVRYAEKTGSTWTVQTAEGGQHGMGVWASLAFDPGTGYPAIFHGWANSVPNECGKRFVSWNGNSWVGEDVDLSPLSAFGTLAYDAASQPIVTYRLLVSGGGPDVLRFARKSGGMWQIEAVDDAMPRVNGPQNMSIGFSGTPCIAYRSQNVFKVARRDAP